MVQNGLHEFADSTWGAVKESSVFSDIAVMNVFSHWKADSPKTWILLLFFISFLVHFIGLSTPGSVVFDEYHFGKFVNAYWSKAHVFSLHPPHNNLVMALVGKWLGYQGNYGFNSIAEVYPDAHIWTLRLFPALCGTLLPVFTVWLLSLMGLSFSGAFLGGWFVLFDNAIVVQSRAVLYDVPLLFGSVSTLVFALCTLRARHRVGLISGAFLSGLMSGLAVGSKFTGLVAPFFTLVLYAWSLYQDEISWDEFFWFLGFFGLGFFVLYVGGWYLHFSLTTLPGDGDRFFKWSESFWDDLIRMHQTMLTSNLHVKATHPDGSKFWSWPFMQKVIYYWTQDNKKIYFMGNPVVWALAALWVSHTLYSLIFNFKHFSQWIKKDQGNTFFILFFTAAYLGSYLPYAPVTRVLFLYHYLPPLIYSILLGSCILDSTGWTKGDLLFRQPRRYYVTLVAVVVGFLMIAPYTYGLPLWAPYDQFFQDLWIRNTH